jgi:hypothetical protein
VDGFKVDTGGGPLPCSFLATLLPQFAGLGVNCRFQGGLVANRAVTGWQVDLDGELTGVDLHRLVAGRLPHEISGIGSLRLKGVHYQAGRIHHMQGSLQAKNGHISRTLVASCMRELELGGTLPVNRSSVLLPYDQLAVRFHLDGSGLGLWGECDSEPRGALLCGGYSQRLNEPNPAFGPIPLTKAIAAVTSTPEDKLLVSRHAARLLQRVPFISSASAATIAAPSRPAAPPARH